MRKIINVSDNDNVHYCVVDKVDFVKRILNVGYEIMLFILRDGTIFTLTNQERSCICFKSWQEFLNEENISACDILAVYHNHHKSDDFSSNDEASYWYLHDLGFNGTYGLYHRPTDKFIYYPRKFNIKTLSWEKGG